MKVFPIPSKEAEPWILNRHYAKRLCPISFAFGLYDENNLIGIVTYGVPASAPLRSGICGEKWKSNVLELNRLCCDNSKNNASILISASLKMLPRPSIVVSYADIAQGHVGYVYQATNWIYTGLSAKRTDWRIKGKEHLHGATIADESRGQKNRAQWMKDKYGDDFYLQERSRKHRYVFFCGTKTQRKQMAKSLLYVQQKYPKGETKRYSINETIETQTSLTL